MTKSMRLEDLSPRLGQQERNYVFAIAMKFMKNEDQAEDVAQDALLLAHRHSKSFRGQSRYSTWLYRVAVTTSLMHLRSRKRKGREVSDSQLAQQERNWIEALISPDASPEQRCASRQQLLQVDSQLQRLGAKYAKLLQLRWFEGYSERELSQKLCLPLSTIKNRSFRARRHVLSEQAQAA